MTEKELKPNVDYRLSPLYRTIGSFLKYSSLMWGISEIMKGSDLSIENVIGAGGLYAVGELVKDLGVLVASRGIVSHLERSLDNFINEN